MPVHIKLSTTLRRHIPEYNPMTGILKDIPHTMTAEALALSIGLPLEEIKVVMINGQQGRLFHEIGPNDRVAYFPAVGGG